MRTVASLIPAGNLRHVMEVLERKVSVGSDSVSKETFESIGPDYAEITPLTGSQLFFARQTHDTVSHEIRMRWRDDIRPGWRLEVSGRTFTIINAINVEERNTVLAMKCSEAVD